MPQIANQDYIYIDLPQDIGLDEINDYIQEVFPILEDKYRNDTLIDCVLRTSYGEKVKILSYECSAEKNLKQVYFVYDGTIYALEKPE